MNNWKITLITVGCILICSFLILKKINYKQDKVSSLDKYTSSKIKIKKKLIDIGKIKIYDIAEAKFKLINIGKSPLLITNVRVSCHCTVVDWSKVPVSPMDSTFIIVLYDSSQPGFFLKKVTVSSNAINSPTLLVLRGEITLKKGISIY